MSAFFEACISPCVLHATQTYASFAHLNQALQLSDIVNLFRNVGGIAMPIYMRDRMVLCADYNKNGHVDMTDALHFIDYMIDKADVSGYVCPFDLALSPPVLPAPPAPSPPLPSTPFRPSDDQSSGEGDPGLDLDF